MASKLEILEYFVERQSDGLAVNTTLLTKKFHLTASGASHWLSRLREQGLIKLLLTSIQRNQAHILTERGIKRIKWLREKQGQAKKNVTPIKKVLRSILDDEEEKDWLFG